MNAFLTAALILVVSFTSGLRAPQRTDQAGSWKKMSSEAPVQFRGTIGAVQAGNRLVVWGGEVGGDTAEQPASDGAVYDIDTDAWKKIAPSPINGRDYHVSLLFGDRLLIWGGRDDSGLRSDGAIYRIGR